MQHRNVYLGNRRLAVPSLFHYCSVCLSHISLFRYQHKRRTRCIIIVHVCDTHSLTYLLIPWSRVLLEKLTGFQLVKKFPAFMGPGSLLPHSQVPTICPCPEPDQSSPRPTSHFLKIHFNIILPSMLGVFNWSFSLGFTHQNPVYNSPFPTGATCPARTILLDFITHTILGEEYRLFRLVEHFRFLMPF